MSLVNWKDKAVLVTGTQQQFHFREDGTISLAFEFTFPEFQVFIGMRIGEAEFPNFVPDLSELLKRCQFWCLTRNTVLTAHERPFQAVLETADCSLLSSFAFGWLNVSAICMISSASSIQIAHPITFHFPKALLVPPCKVTLLLDEFGLPKFFDLISVS
ncbi:hypothetical protein BTVI_50290 [Pitangus sulphuratus]|nr:hypothetical protein BTVI_50290 [Pitangus sulphuratus]